MAKVTHQSNANSAAFGQYGSSLLTSTGTDLTPPAGMYFVAITMLDECTFTDLETVHEANAGRGSFNTEVSDDYDGNGDQLTSSDAFPKGLTVYGEWDKINLASGSLIAYWGPA